MYPENQMTLQKYVAQIILKLHTHAKIESPYEDFKQISESEIYQTIMQLQNLAINSSLQNQIHNPYFKEQTYLENKQYVIPKKIRKVGSIIKIMSKIIDFKGQNQSFLLGSFQTTQFYRQFNKVGSQYFVDFLKGIFPKMNVHKDNLPLYMPFHQNLPNYYSGIIGNSNWQLSREALEFIYKQQILRGQPEQTWYLLLTGHSDIQNRFNNTNIQKIWSRLYLLYVSQTLKPYKITPNGNKQSQNQQTVQKIIQKVTQQIRQYAQQQKQFWNLLIMYLIQFILTDEIDELEKSYQTFIDFYNQQWRLYNSKELQKNQLFVLGVINTLFHQLFLNGKQLHQKARELNISRIQDLQKMIHKSVQINNNFMAQRVPFYDFFLRIFYPSSSKNTDKNTQNNQKILQIFIDQIKSAQQQTVEKFPQYPYEADYPPFYKTLSKVYFQKYPNKILQVYKYIDRQTAVYNLLNSRSLNSFQGFISIKQALQENKKQYLEEINKKVKITRQDYDNFIYLWQKFHQILDYIHDDSEDLITNQTFKIKRTKALLEQIFTKCRLPIQFENHVYLPFKDTGNIMRIMDFLIEGIQQVYEEVKYPYSQLQDLQRLYDQFIKWPEVSKQLLQKLSSEQYDNLWKKWVSLYIQDENFVRDLGSLNQDNHQNPHIIEE